MNNPCNYPDEVWVGNKPACQGHEHINGGYCDKWECNYGGGETYNGNIEVAEFAINSKISIFICGDYLRILDIRHSGKFDVWIYQNRNEISWNLKYAHDLEPNKIQSILNTKIRDCKFWDMVQARAKELYDD